MRKLFPNNTFVAPQLPNPARDLVRLTIAEAPGEDEAEKGQPLVGGSGRVFNSLLRSAGIPRDGLTIVNCVNCRPPDNVFPTDRDAKRYITKENGITAVKQCVRNHVLPILESRSWKRIDLLGGKALWWIAGKFPISKWRGSPVEIDTEEIKDRVRD